MEPKELIGIPVAVLSVLMAGAAAALSQRLRELYFLGIILSTAILDRLSVNFFSHFWYRGTVRGLEFTIADILAGGLLLSMFLRPTPKQRKLFWPASLGFMLVFLLYAALSVALSDPHLLGFFELAKMARAIILFLAVAFFVRGRRELQVLLFGICLLVLFEGALAVKERVFMGVERVTGSLGHANSFSMVLCALTPVLVAAWHSELPWWLRQLCFLSIAAASLSIVLTVSRAGLPIFALATLGTAAFTISLRITLKRVLTAAAIVLGAVTLLTLSWSSIRDRYAQASLEEEYAADEKMGRGVYLRLAAAIVSDRFMGIGLNNWSYAVSKTYGETQGMAFDTYDDIVMETAKEWPFPYTLAAPAHNLAALTVGELGWPGLALFLLLWMRWLTMGLRFLRPRSQDLPRQLAVGILFGFCGVFLQSVTEWVFRQTIIYFLFHVLVGTLAAIIFLREQKPPPHARFLR